MKRHLSYSELQEKLYGNSANQSVVVNQEASQRKERSDRFDIKLSVEAWVYSNCRCEHGSRSNVLHFWTPFTKIYLHEQYALHHTKVRKADGDGFEFILHPEGDQKVGEICIDAFTKHWPSDVQKEKWHKCVCQICYVANVSLEDVLNALNGMHTSNAYLRHGKGVKGTCTHPECPHRGIKLKLPPDATSNCAPLCLEKANDKGLPFLLCCECRCVNDNATQICPRGAGTCNLRNGTGTCDHCGVDANFPKCLGGDDIMVRRRLPQFSGSRISTMNQQDCTFKELWHSFQTNFDKWLPHGLGDKHLKVAKDRLLKAILADPTGALAAFFIDWSDKFELHPNHTATGATYPKLGIMVGVLVEKGLSGKLVATTIACVVDKGDNGVLPTFLFLRRAIAAAKKRNPKLKKLWMMGDGGPKHFRNTLMFFLFPHLQRLIRFFYLKF